MNMYIGIDLGGTNIAAGIVNDKGEIIIKDSIPARSERSGDEVAEDMAKLSLDLIERAGIKKEDVLHIGVGTPGLVDSERGIIKQASNLNFADFPMKEKMESLTGIETNVENDANCAAYAESLYGSSKGEKNSVMITIGTGVGGGIIVDGKIYTGHDFAAGEIGHMVICAGGKKCGCGRLGCYEAYASATGLIDLTKEAAMANPDSLLAKIPLNEINGKTAFEAERKGDKVAAEVVDKYIYYLAIGIGDLIRVLYPDVLVIGGGVSKEGDGLFIPLREKVREEVAFDHKTKILKASLGNDAGIVGAAMLGNK